MKSIVFVMMVFWLAACSVQPTKDEQAMIDAVKGNNTGEIQRLIASGIDVNISSDRTNYITPLGFSALWGDYDAAKFLVDHGADVNSRDEDDFTPLHYAAYSTHKSIAELLINSGALVNAKGKYGETPLRKSLERIAFARLESQSQSPDPAAVADVVDLLIANNAEVSAKDMNGQAPLHFAAGSGNESLVRRLLDQGAEIDPKGLQNVTPLFLSARSGSSDAAILLISHGADVNAVSQSRLTPLYVAAHQGNLKLAKALLDNHADIESADVNGVTPLMMCLKTMLFSYSINSDTPGSKVVRSRMDKNMVDKGRKELKSMEGKWHDVAMLLIDRGANPNVNTDGNTPLGIASLVGDKVLAEKLLAKGVSINEVNNPETYLHAAIAEGHKEVAKLLVNSGIDVNKGNINKRTPLHFMAYYMDDAELTEALIAHGADVNAKDKSGMTPLAVAVQQRNEKVAAVLRKLGAI